MLTLSAPHPHHHHHGGGFRPYYGGGGYYYPPAPEVIVVQADCVRDNNDPTRCCPTNAIVNGRCTLPARRRLFGFRGFGATGDQIRYGLLLPSLALFGLAVYLSFKHGHR